MATPTVTIFPLDAPEYHPDEIPKLLGKGGNNIKNVVRHATKLWYESQEDEQEKVKPPKVVLQVRPTPEDDLTGGIQVAYSTPQVDLELHQKMRPFVWEALNSLVKRLHLGQTASLELREKKKNTNKPAKNSEKKVNQRGLQEGMRQLFRVEMDPMMLGKIVGKEGRNIKNMVKYVEDNENMKTLSKTKIFVKEQTSPMKSGSNHIDLDDFSDGSGKYILFIATVNTQNLYYTMRNVEKAICLSINKSFDFDENSFQKETLSRQHDHETTRAMVEEEDYGDSGW